MAVRRTGNLEVTSRRMANDVQLVIRGLSQEPAVQFAVRFYAHANRMVPVGSRGHAEQGGTSTKNTTLNITSQNPGYLRSTLWTSVGKAVFKRPSPTVAPQPADVAQAMTALKGLPMDGKVFFTYGAPYSAVIEKGRRRIGNRWIGSPQAPEGWVMQASKKALKEQGIRADVKKHIAKKLR